VSSSSVYACFHCRETVTVSNAVFVGSASAIPISVSGWCRKCKSRSMFTLSHHLDAVRRWRGIKRHGTTP
jgi:hypothetical protein